MVEGYSEDGGAQAGEQVDALAARVRRLPPPSWSGPAAAAFETSLGRVARLLDGAGDAVDAARGAARRLGAP